MGVYAFFASTWIIVSDLAVNASVSHNLLDLLLSTSKGLLFVAVTSLLLYVLVRRGEARLQAGEAHFRGLFEFAPVAYQTMDESGRLIDVNRAWLSALGHAHAREIGSLRFEEIVAPSDLERYRQAMASLASGTGIVGLDLELVRLDATRLSVTFDAGASPDGRHVHCIIVDVTHRKQAEETLRRTEDQLRQAQKMEAVGQLAGGVAHDFNNLLQIILGHTQLLLRGQGNGGSGKRNLEMIQRAGERATSLTSQLLAFSRRQILQPRVVDVNALIVESTRMLRRLVREDIALRTALDPALPPVFADAGQMEQVLMNLVVNARDAMPAGGHLTVETSTVMLPDGLPLGSAEMHCGRHVVLSVRDTGHGMDEETRSRIFEPFFTTKEVGQGSGLGLSMVYGIVRQSGGFVACESEPGKGSVFRVYLPEHACEERTHEKVDATEVVASDLPSPVPGGHGETVLVVEDDTEVRELMRDILADRGYAVVVAENGAQALATLDALHKTPDLLLSDVIMPGLGGDDLARLMRARYPGLRVILMSGYTDHPLVQVTGGELGEAVYLQKPFAPDQLAARVHEVLAGRRAGSAADETEGGQGTGRTS